MHRFILVIALFFTTTPLRAQSSMYGFVEHGTTFSEAGESYVIRVSLTKMYSKNLGFFFWGITSSGWNKGLVGGVWAPRSNVQLTLGVGYETNENPTRGIASLSAIGDSARNVFLLIGEHGGSGSWYRLLITRKATSNIALGVNVQRFLGAGPYLSVNVGSTPVQVWAVPAARDLESDQWKATLGVRLRL